MYDNIPKELALIKQWSYSHSLEHLKRPRHTHYGKNMSLSMSEAWDAAADGRFIGFYVTPDDPYILGDIDHVADPEDLSTLPIGLTDVIKNRGAYCEISPSGHGIRFVLKLESAELKRGLLGVTFYTNEKLANKREAQINVGPPWMTITGNTTSYSSDVIGTVTLSTLESAFKIKYKKDRVEHGRIKGWDDAPLPPVQDVIRALKEITLDHNPRIQRAHKEIFHEEYSHYTFWLKVMMALHDYAVKSDNNIVCLDELIKWSETDTESYDGEDSIIEKWESFSTEENHISYRTLFGLAYANIVQWPKAKPLTKKQKAQGIRIGQPLNTEFVNFTTLLQFYDIKVYRDAHSSVKFYVTGDEDIIDTYFKFMGGQHYLEKYVGVFSEKSLTAAMHIFCQEAGFVGISHTQVVQFIRNTVFQSNLELDVVAEYFDTPFEELPKSYQENTRFYTLSTVEYMFSALELDFMTSNSERERDLYETYYRSWLMGLVRNLFFKDSFHMNNCVLLLTGTEQIRKTSHFRFMLPTFMRQEYIAFTTHGFQNESSMRDVVKLSSGNLLVVWDEIEQYLTRDSESNFKKIIDNTPQKFIDKYEVIPSEVHPIAMYGATSNKREFNLSNTGSRRIYHIPVKWVDTDKLNHICWHKLVNDLRKEVSAAPCDVPPWLLTKSQLQYQAQLHLKITNKTGMEFVLSEMFFWETMSCIRFGSLPKEQRTPRTSVNCYTFTNIKKLVAQEIGRMPHQTEQIALKRSLIKLCSNYTQTQTQRKKLDAPRASVYQGQMVYNGVVYFITPKRVTEEA